MRIFYNIIFLVFLFQSLDGFSQGDEPWFNSSVLNWNNTSNITAIRSGQTHFYTATTESAIGNPGVPSCGSGTNDVWLRIPYTAGTTSVSVRVTFTNSDYTPTIDDTRPRYAIYRGTSGACTGSGTCNLTYVSCSSDNDLDESGESDCPGSSLYYVNLSTNNIPVSANEDIFIRLWEQDNDAEHRYTVYAIRNGTSPVTPNNDACSSPQFITAGAPCPYSGTIMGAGGGQFPALGSGACSWGLQEDNVYYEFEATSTSSNIQFNGVNCFWTGCTGVPGLALQYAVFRKVTPCTNTSLGDIRNVPSDPTVDCFIGQGTVGGVVDGLTPGQRYIIVLDGWNAAPCTWTGITITNTPSLPTVNNINKCIGDVGTASTLTISNTRPGYTYSWTANPADPSLAGQTANATINVTPLVTTAYTCTINMGSSGNLCNGISAAAYPVTGTVNILDPVGSRIAPTGAQCSGTQLNFTASPVGGNGTYTYNWTSNNPSGTSGTGQNFSFTPTNTGCSDIQLSVNLSVTSNGLTCPRPTAFTPTIRPNPSLTANPLVECLTGNVRVGQAAIGSCACTACSYTLEACTGCGSGSTPVGTTDTGRNFMLYDATGATFSASLNGCKSANQIRNFLVDCPTQLPVELIRFSVICSENSYVLNWTTASESDNSHFDIEKSADAITWRKTGEIRGAGNSSHLIEYEFKDTENSSGRVYYRLKQIDHDGTFSYSEIINKECNHSTQPVINIFPNPVTETIFIQYEFEESQGYLFFKLFDDIGRLIKSAGFDLTNKSNSGILQIPVGDLAKGIYFMKINSEENLNETRKLVFK